MERLLKLNDLTDREIREILDAAERMKYERKYGAERRYLTGRTLGMIFSKASVRTRAAFEAGVNQLGGGSIFLTMQELQRNGEQDARDTARSLSGYVDAFAVRADSQDALETFAGYTDLPVVNAGTDTAHPCRALADLMTIRAYKYGFEGLKIAILGRRTNASNSLAIGAAKLGMRVCCASGDESDWDVGETVAVTMDPAEAVRGADVVYAAGACADADGTFPYCLDEKLLAFAKPNCMVLHGLPARRGEEISDSVLEAHAETVFSATENRLHIHKAVLLAFLGRKKLLY